MENGFCRIVVDIHLFHESHRLLLLFLPLTRSFRSTDRHLKPLFDLCAGALGFSLAVLHRSLSTTRFQPRSKLRQTRCRRLQRVVIVLRVPK